MRHQPFVASISAQPSYPLGDSILITFELENISSDAYQVLTWGTPFEGKLTDDCLQVAREGEPIPYDGKLVKRGDPPPSAYALLRPGERLKSTVDISEAYAIDQVGDYGVTLRASFFDAFVVPGNAKAGPRKRTDHEPHNLPTTSAAFEVVAGAQPKQTSGQAAREASAKRAKSAAKAPNFNGGSATDHADAIVAHNNAQYFAALAGGQLDAGPASTNSLFKTWFGAFDQGRYDEVTKDYKDISNTLLSEQVTYDFTGDGHGSDTCNPGDFAFTYKGDRTVWLCSSYISAAQIGTDCKFGTLVHEWSHAVASTDDNAYGETACKNLANTDPGKAVNNADSHEYFTEHLAQSDFGKTFAFITDRSTFGKDEIDAMLLQSSPAVISKAFYVVADGFWPDKLGITASTLGNSPTVKPTIGINPSVSGMSITVTSLEAEDTTLPVSPQRFTWVCQISFANSGGFPAGAGATQTINLTATLGGLSASAQIILIREPNPYEIDGPTSWLSTDVRVFQLRAGDSRFGVSMVTDANAYIKQVIANLNSGSTGGDTFDNISTDEQASQLELSQKVGGTNVYNFAVAKVRYRGTTDISNVRVFFRLFPASTTSTAFDIATTYRRATTGGKTIALLGLSGSGDLLTIPCFAEGRINSASADLSTQADPANMRTIVHAAGEAAAYFGCWLDINQTTAQFPTNPSPANGPWSSGRKTIQELIRNAHQCLVAEIAFDPIPAGISPAASDKLAQRNLAVVESANPGLASSRTILSTFELHPARGPHPPDPAPDELLIEWGNTPRDAVATIYIPEIGAGQIIALAASRYVGNRLTQVDTQTIQMPVGGISYVPLPPGASFGLTGLLSIELPPTVIKGEVYKIVVRQITDTFGRRPAPAPDPGVIRAIAATAPPGTTDLIRWRRVVGTYQLTIPVRTKEVMVDRETRLLSVLRWILQSVPTGNRWHPVFSRYVGLIGDRVGALGGDPDKVRPSPDGSGAEPGGATGHEPPDRTQRYEGKVTGLIYDCFGDFEGFLLNTCCTEIAFHSREHRIEALARLAWRERIAIVVVAGCGDPHHPVSIILRHAPEPFQG
jgi:hypothetical protein